MCLDSHSSIENISIDAWQGVDGWCCPGSFVRSLLKFLISLKELTFRYCQLSVDLYFLGLTLFLSSFACSVSSIFLKETLHTMLRYSKFSTNNSLEINYLFLCGMCGHNIIEKNKWFFEVYDEQHFNWTMHNMTVLQRKNISVQASELCASCPLNIKTI